MSVTIPSLDPVTDILDTDTIMVTQSSGQTYTINGASFNKRNQAIIANSTTLTGAPLKTGNIVRAYFTADITGVNTTTGLVLNYNGTNKNVKVPKNGALVNFTAQNMGGSPTVYKYLQSYTTLELLYDGTNFVIIGNPVVISSSDYTIYADGLKRVDSVIQNDKNMVTGNAVNILYKSQLPDSLQYTSSPAKEWTEIGMIFINECKASWKPTIVAGQFYNMGIFIGLALWTSGDVSAKNGTVFLFNHSGSNIIRLSIGNGVVTAKYRIALPEF